MTRPMTSALAIAVTAVTVSAASPSAAGPLPTRTADVKSAVPSDIVSVRNRGGAIVAGVALGLLGAAAIASSPYYSGYYGPAYYRPYPWYPPLPSYYPPYRYGVYGGYGPSWAYGPRLYRPYPHYRHYRYRRAW